MVLLRKTLNMLAFCLVCLTATSQTMVYLERAGNLSFDQERIADAQILKNNVVFRHEDALMYCDSAYFYETSNSLDAFGHVRFVQGDTLKGFCDKLFYDGNTRLARMRQKVRMIHGRAKENPTILTTDSLNYDRRANLAYYYTGGTVRDSLNTLTSVRGQYAPNKKQAVFSQDVKLVNPNFILTSDTLLYPFLQSLSPNQEKVLKPAQARYILQTSGKYQTSSHTKTTRGITCKLSYSPTPACIF